MGLLNLKYLFGQPKLYLSLKLNDSKPGPYFWPVYGTNTAAKVYFHKIEIFNQFHCKLNPPNRFIEDPRWELFQPPNIAIADLINYPKKICQY